MEKLCTIYESIAMEFGHGTGVTKSGLRIKNDQVEGFIEGLRRTSQLCFIILYLANTFLL